MIEIQNGQAWQWDIEKSVFVDDDINEVHFSLNNEETAKVVTPEQNEARIPDEFLQDTGSIKVFAVKDNQTIETKNFPITARPKPEDYYMPPKPPKVELYPHGFYTGKTDLTKKAMHLTLIFVGDHQFIDEVRLCRLIKNTNDPLTEEEFNQLNPSNESVFVKTLKKEDGSLSLYNAGGYAFYMYQLWLNPDGTSNAGDCVCYRFEWDIDGKSYRSNVAISFLDNWEWRYQWWRGAMSQPIALDPMTFDIDGEDFQ